MARDLETDARAGLLADLARGGAMWLSDVCLAWCGGNRSKCSRLVDALVAEGLVVLRKPERGDRRRRYLVLTRKGVERLRESGLGVSVGTGGGSRLNRKKAEAAADHMVLYTEISRAGVDRESILVGTDLRRRLRFKGRLAEMVGIVSGGQTTVVARLPLPWKKWQEFFHGTSPVSLWVVLAGNSRAWSQQLDVWTRRPLARPTWLPKPSWPLSRVVELLKNQRAVVNEVKQVAVDRGLDLTFPETRGTRHASAWAEQQTWCCLAGEFYRLEDFRPVPVHWLSLLVNLAPDEAERVLQCAGIIAVVETQADAVRLGKRMRQGAPCVFLALESKPGRRLLRYAQEGLKPIA